MLKKILKPYQGLSKEVWFMALTMFVNRAGAMVVPFLSLYLTNFLDFSLEKVGWIMSCYGLGSVAGVFIGGKLADRIGYYKVMYIEFTWVPGWFFFQSSLSQIFTVYALVYFH